MGRSCRDQPATPAPALRCRPVPEVVQSWAVHWATMATSATASASAAAAGTGTGAAIDMVNPVAKKRKASAPPAAALTPAQVGNKLVSGDVDQIVEAFAAMAQATPPPKPNTAGAGAPADASGPDDGSQSEPGAETDASGAEPGLPDIVGDLAKLDVSTDSLFDAWDRLRYVPRTPPRPKSRPHHPVVVVARACVCMCVCVGVGGVGWVAASVPAQVARRTSLSCAPLPRKPAGSPHPASVGVALAWVAVCLCLAVDWWAHTLGARAPCTPRGCLVGPERVAVPTPPCRRTRSWCTRRSQRFSSGRQSNPTSLRTATPSSNAS